MTTVLYTHKACLGHETPPGHPESADRLRAILDELQDVSGLVWAEAPLASRADLARAHTAGLIENVLTTLAARAAEEHYVRIDADTAMSAGSSEAALRAAGAVIAATDAVMAGRARNAFCAVRPPGHHAERKRAMGFCLFNNVAIGSLHLRDTYGLNRIAVIDFDVHHGNGTQDIFWNDPDLFYASTHQSPLYPGTGRASETGAANNIVNAPLQPGAGGEAFRAAFSNIVLPALDSFRPEFVLVSAGFDAHKADPLAELRLDEEDFAWATSEICALAQKHCSARVVSALEGGYDLQALARSARAHVEALMEA